MGKIISNDVCSLLGIEYPIFQGGMAWVSDADLAAAVSNAGGLGIIAAGNAPKEWIVEQIKKTKMMTDKPFAVNVMLLSPFVDDIVDAVIEEKVEIVVTGAGNPGKYFKKLNDNGVKIIPVVPSVSQAIRMERNQGVVALIAEGAEAGGHIGVTNTMSLIPQIVDTVDIPVIAAGGIADGRGMAAAFCLGASAIQVGTRFLVADECNVADSYKEKVINAKDTSTMVTGNSTGHPVRVIKNKFAKKFKKMEDSKASAEELEVFSSGSLRNAVVDGDVENGSIMAGQIAGLVNKKESCKSIIEDIINMYERTVMSIND
ncbi:enoyl-[acyl-carrier-protein] reductase FabK [Peptostreptococcus canis]|uniref:Probable nitronate monooxygenase n=1 Tax=Peptostreptococcus canis TaxID=1159213 RepID=A0ABR6TK78_9FIRM|nr:enoyl-[acyl-carrier-protein] reductase FabK [Peptostreptococcus canis]MBC2575810.1 enoyl-[acyl-carrier-protein] reductase FabK [Peptostreptococcus canis]MBP1998074.1 enoyl-[acyl-carrier protein] reductase II [Peptostreptococcus canis]